MYQIAAQERQISKDDLLGIRRAIIHDVLLGKLAPALALPHTEALPFQIVLFRPHPTGPQLDPDMFARLFHAASQADCGVDLISMESDQVLLLWGEATIHKFEDFLQQWQQEGSAVSRTLRDIEPFFLSCGRVSFDPEDLPHSYRDVCTLMQQHFFCKADQRLLRMEDVRDSADYTPVINALLLEKYTKQLLQCIQSFNRTMTVSVLSELESLMLTASDSPDAIRLFFVDLYMQIKEQMKHLYQGHTIPFYTNSHIIKTILQAPQLNDITCFLAQRFDMIMAAIGASSQESVLDSILYYIQHNFTSNITLESIAPLFGYNHSYLGKIFRKKMHISFNEYIDHLRVDRAKELLLQSSSKVYAISKQVGYKNVDYFHVKFRKYVNMSPVEFRRLNQMALHSPDEENAEKGSLFSET